MFHRLIFSDEMIEFLSVCPVTKLSDVLIHGNSSIINEEGNFIKRETTDSDVLSYLPKSEYSKLDTHDPYGKGLGRIKIKIGRFLRKFLSDSTIKSFGIKDSDIEEFVNFYKSYFNASTSEIKIVHGEEILHWYLEENYFKPNGMIRGTLWNSCMRYKDRNKFMKLYSKNSSIQMAVFLVDGKVRTRALLWNDVKDSNGEKIRVMDRIYSVYDHDVFLFKKWAVENRYIPKFYQNAKTESIMDIGGVPTRMDLVVNLENYDFLYYPYLDTFKFFNEYKGRLSNSQLFSYDYVLVQSNGALEPEPEPEQDTDDY